MYTSKVGVLIEICFNLAIFLQILHKGRSAVGNSKDKSFLQADGGSKFAGYFPQAMCVYVWFLEAADSHRLNTQMLWSIKRKIAVLTEY
jgi:hypothetical protein